MNLPHPFSPLVALALDTFNVSESFMHSLHIRVTMQKDSTTLRVVENDKQVQS